MAKKKTTSGKKTTTRKASTRKARAKSTSKAAAKGAKKTTTRKKATTKKSTTRKKSTTKKATTKKVTTRKKSTTKKAAAKVAAKSSKKKSSSKKKASTKTAQAAANGNGKAGNWVQRTSVQKWNKQAPIIPSYQDDKVPMRLSPEREPLSPAQLRKVKTGLTRSDLQHFRQLLLAKRAEILGDVASLEDDARADSGDHLSPEHMADIGSHNYEQEFTLALAESERRIVREIDLAIARIADKTYGVCIETGVPIGKPRLDAKPWAKYCIEVVRERERRGLSS